eukprot:Nitzschia sp. Nitz4//scaffold21_size171442//96770//98158//NITZ4_002172-RA/size171442-processed-gene-0.19-mRNA-1//1//CDS//3329542444//7359//frame0
MSGIFLICVGICLLTTSLTLAETPSNFSENIGHTHEDSLESLFATFRAPSKYSGISEIPHSPRIVVLGVDTTFAQPLTANMQLPVYGDDGLKAKYIPLSGAVPQHKPPSELDHHLCHKLGDWQESHNPNCNVLHESSAGFSHPFGAFPRRLPLPHVGEWESPPLQRIGLNASTSDEEFDRLDQLRFVGGGAFRWVWMIREFDGTKLVVKTLRADSDSKKFDLRNFDRHRRDAVATAELTHSPFIVNIYGYCSNSAIYDWGEGGDLLNIFRREPNIAKEKLLEIAYNASLAVHDAHHFDNQGRATMAHTDIKPDQFLYQEGIYRLNDFNRVRFLTWNSQTDEECGFRVQKNGGNWRAPEEYDYKLETEKVDVYSLGNVLYFLLTRGEPWDGYRSKQLYPKVIRGERPIIPEHLKESDHPFNRFMIEAIQMAWTHKMKERPAALRVAEKLREGLQELRRLTTKF